MKENTEKPENQEQAEGKRGRILRFFADSKAEQAPC
jgi:hypothetical protein